MEQMTVQTPEQNLQGVQTGAALVGRRRMAAAGMAAANPFLAIFQQMLEGMEEGREQETQTAEAWTGTLTGAAGLPFVREEERTGLTGDGRRELEELLAAAGFAGSSLLPDELLLQGERVPGEEETADSAVYQAMIKLAAAGNVRLNGADGPETAARQAADQNAETVLLDAPRTAQPQAARSAAAPVLPEQAEQSAAAVPAPLEQAARSAAAVPVLPEQTEQSAAAVPVFPERAEQSAAAAPVLPERAEQSAAAAPVLPEQAAQSAAAVPVPPERAEQNAAASRAGSGEGTVVREKTAQLPTADGTEIREVSYATRRPASAAEGKDGQGQSLYDGQSQFRGAVEEAKRAMESGQTRRGSGAEDVEQVLASLQDAQNAARTPAANRTAASLERPVENQPPLAEQLQKGVGEQLKLGKNEFTLKLKPASLGEITVKLVEKAGKTTLTILTASAQTAKLINSDLAALREAVKPMAVEVREAVPQTSENQQSQMQQFAGQQFTGQQQQFAQFAGQRQHIVRGDSFAEVLDPGAAEEAPAAAQVLDTGGMDYYI